MHYVIGCDIGSQSAKAVLVAFDGVLAGEAAVDYAIDYPRPLWAEQPVARWTDALTQAIQRLLATTGVNTAQVRGLGLASQVDGVVPVDAAGQPLYPAIIWMDRRAGPQCTAVRQHLDRLGELAEPYTFQITGLNLDASHVAPKIRWLAETQPEIYKRTAHFLLPGSYVARFLTGETAVDYANASSTLLLDVHTKRWSPAMCALWGIEPERLAPIGPATARLARLRPSIAETVGLSPQTMVVIGSGDEHAACLGAGVLRPGLVADIAGTAEPVCAATPTPLFDASRLVETHCHAAPDLWLLENPGFVSGGNLRWYRDHFGAQAVATAATRQMRAYQVLDEQAMQIAPGADGLIFLPCLMGAMAPTWNESVRGTFLGFTLAHTHAHFTRAILEGSAYAIRDIVDQMKAMGLEAQEVRVMGGGAQSRLWNQIKADVTGVPVAVPQVTETTALGAAMLALVGVGAYAGLAEAAEQIVQIVERFEPQPSAQRLYAEYYNLYRQTYFALLPVFTQAAHLEQHTPTG